MIILCHMISRCIADMRVIDLAYALAPKPKLPYLTAWPKVNRAIVSLRVKPTSIVTVPSD